MPDEVKAKLVGREVISAHYRDPAVAVTYEQERFSFPLADAVSRREIELMKHLVSKLPSGAKLLNIAPGPARIARHLKPPGEAVALDSSREMLEIAEAYLNRNDWRLVEGDAFALPWSQARFDLVFAFRINVDQASLMRLRRTLAAVVVEDGRDRETVAAELGLPVFAIHPAARARQLPVLVLPTTAGPFTLASLSSPLELAQIHGKGYPELIAAIARLPDIRLNILWRGSACLDEVRALIRQHGVEDRVRILPERTPVLDVIGGAHAVVALFRPGMHTKAVPQSVIDGLATGRPALVAEGSAIAHLLRPSGAAVISELNPDAIAVGITKLCTGAMTMRGPAIRAAEEMFSVDRFVAAYSDVYRAATRRVKPGRWMKDVK